MCVGDTGTFGENGAQLCVLVILIHLRKMKHSCVCWRYWDIWGKWSRALCGGDTGTTGENGAQLCVGDFGKLVENGAEMCVLLILGQLRKVEHSFVCW